jgi:hypothetical protein
MSIDKVTANLFFEIIKELHEEMYRDLSRSILGKDNIHERNYIDTQNRPLQSDKVHELIRRNVWAGEVDHPVEDIRPRQYDPFISGQPLRMVSNMYRNRIAFPDIIYGRHVMNEYSFILEVERIINSILNNKVTKYISIRTLMRRK